jgi:hypothetical protein
MALNEVDTFLTSLCDRYAYQVASGRASVVGGTSYWNLWDALSSASETFVDALGDPTLITNADASLSAMRFGQSDALKAWNRKVDSAFSSVYGVASGVGGIDSYLASRKLRIAAQAAQVLSDAGIALSVANIAGDADAGASAPGISLGNITQGGTLAGAASISALYAPSPICARVTVKSTGSWTLTVTPVREPVVAANVTQVVLGSGDGGTAGDVYVIGRQAIGGGGAAAGQATIPMASTGAFKVGETVLVSQWSGAAPSEAWLEQETGTVLTVNTDTSIVLASNLLHTYTSAGFVDPCLRGLSACTGSGGSASDRVFFYVKADRRIRL